MSTAPGYLGLGEVVDAGRRMIPFDYAFHFTLTGKPRNVVKDAVTVSVEATFVAVSIRYGVVPKVTPIDFGPATLPTVAPGGVAPELLPQVVTAITLGSLLASLATAKKGVDPRASAEELLRNGFKLNPEVADLILSGSQRPSDEVMGRLFRLVGAPPERIQFKYALYDAGSGREFQSEPILSIAGLGIADGDRPFRHFSPPISFAPRSTIRMEITEVSTAKGDLDVALHGYKILGGAGTPTARVPQRARRR